MSRMPVASTTSSENPVSAEVTARDGARIPVTMHGSSGPAIIFVHGWSCSAAFWGQQAVDLSRHVRVITLDLPGHGRAEPVRPSGRWSIEEFGADIVAVADWAGCDVVLVGHSMGGAVALEAAIELGPRCRALIGVDTFTEAGFYAARPPAEIAERRAVFETDFAGTMCGMIAAITGEGVEADLALWIGNAMSATEPNAALGVLEALLSWDIMPRWDLCTAPRTTINSAMLARRNEFIELAGLDVRLMEGVGHFPMLENPGEFNARLLNALTDLLG